MTTVAAWVGIPILICIVALLLTVRESPSTFVVSIFATLLFTLGAVLIMSVGLIFLLSSVFLFVSAIFGHESWRKRQERNFQMVPNRA
jgi:hypothetical protein